MAEGGPIPKNDDWDKVPLMLERGCIITSPLAAKAHEAGFLKSLNTHVLHLTDVTDHQAELLYERPRYKQCWFFWGSHGCGLPEGHEGKIHTCDFDDVIHGPCSQYDEEAPADRRVRFAYSEPDVWGDWRPYGDGWWMEPRVTS